MNIEQETLQLSMANMNSKYDEYEFQPYWSLATNFCQIQENGTKWKQFGH